jgi:hypothetical protein
MMLIHRALASALVLLSVALCQSDDEYAIVNCEYHRIGSVCDCQYSPEVSFVYFSYQRASETDA